MAEIIKANRTILFSGKDGSGSADLDPTQLGMINLGFGVMALGDRSTRFMTTGIFYCLGFVLRNPKADLFALMHTTPYMDLKEYMKLFCGLLSGGEAILVQGPISNGAETVIEALGEYRINHIKTIKIGMPDNCSGPAMGGIDLAFAPVRNHILVAQPSTRIVYEYMAF